MSRPRTWTSAVGAVLILLVLEATRRATGWIMPVLSMMFFAYGLWGNYLPAPWTHKGYPIVDLIAELYMTLERHLRLGDRRVGHADHPVHHLRRHPAGLGGGQLLHRLLLARHEGPAQRGRPRRRAVVVPAGRAVGLGRRHHRHASAPWPGRCMRQAGYGKTAAGGLLAAGGLGAILSPPVLGAAAFLIAEYLKIVVPRRRADGDRADVPLLLRPAGHDRDRFAQVPAARRRSARRHRHAPAA